jgi:hypothetical protein
MIERSPNVATNSLNGLGAAGSDAARSENIGSPNSDG